VYVESYEKEQKEIEQKIWSLFDVEGNLVVDVGVGKSAMSARTLITKGATVVAADSSMAALQPQKDAGALLVCCDIREIPFKKHAVDLIMFYFTLHEIDPHFHRAILSQTALTASQVAIVEPTPGTTPGYEKLERLWRESMHAVGKFEDYHPVEYWDALIRAAGFNVVLSETVGHKERVPPEKMDDIVDFTVEWFEEEHVPEPYIHKAKTLLDAKEEMKLSDIAVVVGQSRHVIGGHSHQKV
jgi:hypothetical protein